MNEKAPQPDPGLIMKLSTAYWDSQVFLTANRIGVFEYLADRDKTVEDIAHALDTHVRPTQLMLNACTALGLLEKTEQGFRNSEIAKVFLLPGKPTYMGNAAKYSDDLYSTWGKLEQALRDDKPMLEASQYLGDDEERTRHFVYAMHNRALGTAHALTGMLNLAGRRQVLDIGGGPGTYSCLLAAQYPDVHCKVMDLPRIVAHAKDIIASMGQQERVQATAGDYHLDTFSQGNDVVIISGVFHRETPQMCQTLIEKAHASLVSGGLLIISDVFTDKGGTSPVFATLFSLNMLLTAENGGIHEDADVSLWMQKAGFAEIVCTPFPQPMPHRLIQGVKLND